MANATDFIPQEAEIEVTPAYYIDDVKNLASDEEIVSQIKQTVDEYDTRFTSQREEYTSEDSGLWNQMDAAFRSWVNDSSVQTQKQYGANEPDDWERAKIGTTQFYRQVTQMASNGYAVQTSKDMPFKYEALQDNELEGEVKNAEDRAKKLNLLAKWSMKRDKFDLKTIEFWTQVKKYGNVPVMVEWLHERGRKTVRTPIYKNDDPTKVDSYKTEEIETVINNRPVFRCLPIESVKADSVIGDIQSQECVIVSSVVSMSDIIDGIASGFYLEETLENINTSQQWDGFSGFENAEDKKDNRAMENKPTNTETGQYLKREVFVNVPISEDDDSWDIMKNVPKRYRVTMFGNTAHESVVARIERNQEPDDSIPIEMIHANPDDSDLLYHISNYEVVRGNLAAENTLVRQTIDNGTLVNKPPLKEVSGEVQGNDRTFKPDARFIVDNMNSIDQMNVQSLAQQNTFLLDYLKEDSNTANSIDKNMIGESFGARTSASEAGTISSNSRRPNLVNIEYILQQLLPFVAQRYKVNWEAYGLPEQVVQITDEDDNTVLIRPTDIAGDYDIVVDIIDDIKDDAVEAQRMINYAQTVAQTPMAQTVDWQGLNEVLAEKMMGTSKFVVANNEGDAEANARSNLVLMLAQGQFPQMADNMNLKKHLSVYKDERRRWTGSEDQNPNVQGVLDQVIAQIEARIDQQSQQGAQQQAQPTAPAEGGEVARQEASGVAGGL